jgi:hypothetical protein
MARRALLWIALSLMCVSHGYAQTGQTKEPGSPSMTSSETGDPNPEPTQETAGSQLVNFTSDFEFWLSLIVILFGAFVVVIEYKLLLRVHSSPADIMRVLAVTLILVGSLFLITAGFSNNQISPVSGLFGTVAGYLLGKSSKLQGRDDKPNGAAAERKEEKS